MNYKGRWKINWLIDQHGELGGKQSMPDGRTTKDMWAHKGGAEGLKLGGDQVQKGVCAMFLRNLQS